MIYLVLALAAMGTADLSRTTLPLALLLGGAAIWFLGLQMLVLRRLCLYCVLVHLLGLACAALALFLTPTASWWGSALWASVPLIALVAGQVFLKPRLYAVVREANAQSPSAEPTWHSVVLLGGKIRLMSDDWPIIGNSQAPHLIACLFDYTCPECRDLHHRLREALDGLVGQVAVLMLPVPQDPACNDQVKQKYAGHERACEYARLALALWLADATRYDAYDRWFFGGQQPPTLEQARAFAQRLLEQEGFEKAASAMDIDRHLSTGLFMFQRSGTGKLPTLLLPGAAVFGQLPTAQALLALLRRELALEPLAAVL